MRAPRGSKNIIVAGALLFVAAAASGCLSGDTSVVPPLGGLDAAPADGGPAVFDASGTVDAPAVPTPGAEAGVSIMGLVPAGTTSKSPGFVLHGAAGATHAPVAQSPNYRLVGGMAVSTQKP